MGTWVEFFLCAVLCLKNCFERDTGGQRTPGPRAAEGKGGRGEKLGHRRRGFPRPPGAMTHPGHSPPGRWLRAVPGIDWRATLWPQAPRVVSAAAAWIMSTAVPGGSRAAHSENTVEEGLGQELKTPLMPSCSSE